MVTVPKRIQRNNLKPSTNPLFLLFPPSKGGLGGITSTHLDYFFKKKEAIMVTHINAKTLYEQDFNLWLEETVNLLKNRQLDQLDYDNLIEEIESMARKDKRALESNLEQILMHLLKWQYQKNKRSNSWRYSIIEHRNRLKKDFRDSPSLKTYFDDVLEDCYQTAREFASEQTGLDIKTFPIDLPFIKENILDPNYLPED
jgi:hypothetical protein